MSKIMLWTSSLDKTGWSSFFNSPLTRSMGGSPELRWQSEAPCWTPNDSSWVMSIPVSFLVRLAGPSRSNQADNRRGNAFVSFCRGIMRWVCYVGGTIPQVFNVGYHGSELETLGGI